MLHFLPQITYTMKKLSYVWSVLLGILLISSCDEDNPPPAENEEEVITNVTVTFTPEGGGDAIQGTWVDADGEGSGDPVVSDITLAPNTTYTMDIRLVNLIDPSNSVDITEEVEEEGAEHQFFFGWTDGLFTNPAGNGNIDNQDDAVVYEDEDENGRPIGLTTRWTTGDAATGTFRILLMHQPDIKSDDSSSEDGEPDVDVEWEMTVE